MTRRPRLSPGPDVLAVGGLCLLVLIAMWPLIGQPGLLNTRGGGDSPFLLQRLQQLETALRDGHFPVRWMPDANYGYGYPFFNYYAPLSLYGALPGRLLGMSYVGAIELAQGLGFLAAALAMYALGRRWFRDRGAALLAATAYTVAPFHLVNVYVRGDSLAEFWAMAFFPLTLLAAEALLAPANPTGRSRPGRDRGRLRPPLAVAGLGLAYAGLVLSHNISALIFSPFLILYCLVRLAAQPAGRGRALAHLAGAGLLGLALSAWFWLPALAETGLAQTEPVTSGYFHYGGHFRGRDLVQPTFIFDYDVAEGEAFRMGLVQAAAVAAGAAALLALVAWPPRAPEHRAGERRAEERRAGERRAAERRAEESGTAAPARAPHRWLIVYLLLALAGSSLMITPLSRPVWDALPLLPFAQFPWRFLSIQALAGAAAVGALALVPGRRLLVPAAGALLVVSGLAGLRPESLPLSDADVTAYALAQYEWFSGNIGSTVSAEYLPRTAQPRPQTSAWLNAGRRDPLLVVQGAATGQLQARRTQRQVWQIAVVAGPARIILPTLYWPGWEVWVNGTPVEAGPAPGSGLLSLALPVGKHQVTLRLGRTPPRVVAEVVSAVALLPLAWLLGPGMAGVWVGARRRPRAAWGLLLALGVLAAWLRLGPSPAYNDAAASWDFAQLAYLHPAPAGIPFADGVRLARYAYDRDDVLAGRRLVLTLEWDAAAAGGPVEVALVTPADTRPALLAQVRPPAVARGEGAVAPGISRVELAIPADAPAGLYVPRLRRPGVPAVTPARQSRGDLYLKPVRIRAPDAPVLAESALPVTPTLIVQPAAVQVRADGALDVRLRWTTFQPLGANYAVSLRLAESDGPLLAQFDGQPGFGFLPSSGWPVNEPVYDWLALPRPAGLDGAEQPLSLTVTLYDPVTLEPVLVRRLGELSGPAGALAFRPTEPVFVLPPGLTPQAVTFQDPSDGRDLIRLHGFTVDLAGDALDLTLYWGALVGGLDDFRVFVHVVDPAGDTIVAQADGRPQAGAYPTGQWVVGEVVADPVRLALDAAPAGSYDLYVGLYRLVDGAPLRLPARDDAAGPVADARVKLPFLVTRSR